MGEGVETVASLWTQQGGATLGGFNTMRRGVAEQQRIRWAGELMQELELHSRQRLVFFFSFLLSLPLSLSPSLCAVCACVRMSVCFASDCCVTRDGTTSPTLGPS